MRPNTMAALVLISAALISGSRLAATSKPLPSKHAKNGLSCFDCHRNENPTQAAVPEDSCMVCHGDDAAMAAYTKHLPVNPHDPPKKKGHPGPFACTECHHQHKVPEVKCLECHTDFKLKAPL